MFQKIMLVLVFASCIFMLQSGTVHAAPKECRSKFGIPTWYRYLPTNGDCEVKNDSSSRTKTIPLIILGFIDIALWLAGLLAVVMIIWGGYLFLLSNGDPGKIANGRNTILNAVIGLIIAILASQIVKFIASKLSG